MDAEIVDAVEKARAVIVLTGAGISTNVPANIPDYKTSGLRFSRDEVGSPKYLAFVNRCRAAQPTATHQFCAWLESRGVLRRIYTQNVDRLHHRTAGVPENKIVEVHGSVETDIVFDGETVALAQPAVQRMLEADFDATGPPDLCLVLGTALQKMPFMALPNRFPRTACRIFVNKDCSGLPRANEIVGPELFGLGYGGGIGLVKHPSVKIAGQKVTSRPTWLDARTDTARRDDWQHQYIVETDCDVFCQEVMQRINGH